MLSSPETIGIIVLSYNQGHYIERLFKRLEILKESVDEIIIVDACSTDNTPELIEKYSHIFSKKIIEVDKGPSDGLNKGFNQLSTTWAYYINSDDLIELESWPKAKSVVVRVMIMMLSHSHRF